MSDGGTIRDSKYQAFGVCRAKYSPAGDVTGFERCMLGLSKIYQGDDEMIFESVQQLIDDILLCYNFIFVEDEAALAKYNVEDTDLADRVVDVPEALEEYEEAEEAEGVDADIVAWNRSGKFDVNGFICGVAGATIDHGETSMPNKILPWMDGIAGERPHILALACAMQSCASTLHADAHGPWPTQDCCLPDRLRATHSPSGAEMTAWQSSTVAGLHGDPRIMDADQLALHAERFNVSWKAKSAANNKKELSEAAWRTKGVNGAKKYMKARRKMTAEGKTVGMVRRHAHVLAVVEMRTCQGGEYRGTIEQSIRRHVVSFLCDEETLAWKSIRRSEYCFLHKIIKAMEKALGEMAELEVKLRAAANRDDAATNLKSRVGSFTVAVLLSVSKLMGRGYHDEVLVMCCRIQTLDYTVIHTGNTLSYTTNTMSYTLVY